MECDDFFRQIEVLHFTHLFTFTMADKIQVFVYTSSHGLTYRFFPQEFQLLFHQSGPFELSLSNIFAKGGRRLSRQIVDDIKSTATKTAPLKQVIIINLGDNNLRHGENRPEELRHLVSSVLEHCHGIPGCWVVFSSLIPSIGHYNTTKESFSAFNRVMKEETDKFTFSSFCQFTRRLFVNGVLEPSYFTDDVHLSQLGAEIFARALHRHLQYLTKKF